MAEIHEKTIDRREIAKKLRHMADSVEEAIGTPEVKVELIEEFDYVHLGSTYCLDGYLALYVEAPKGQ